MGQLAAAYVEIGSKTKGFDDGLKSSEAKLKDFVEKSNSLLGSIGLAVGVGGTVAFLKSAVTAASDLGETMSKVEQVFGKSTGTITAMADDMASKFGSVRQTTLDAAASIGLVAQASGMTEQAAAGLSVRLVRLADDASSFFNVPLEDALLKIRSGLVGESEPLRAFGVLLSEAAVQAKAQQMGLTGLHGELTEGQKVMARSQIIIEQLNKASGDHERTLGSYTNQVRALSGAFENLKASIGQTVLPAATATATGLNEGSGFMAKLISQEGIGGALKMSIMSMFSEKSRQEMINSVVAATVGPEATMPKPASHGPDKFAFRGSGADFLSAQLKGDPGAFGGNEFSPQPFAGGGFGAFGMMGTLGLEMARKGAVNDVDRAIDQVRKPKWQGSLGNQSVDAFLQSAQSTVLDDSNKKQLDELKAIRETLVAIRDNKAMSGPQLKQGTFVQGRE